MSRRPSQPGFAALLLAPAALLLLLVVAWPIATVGGDSVQGWRLTSGRPAHFVGLANYWRAFADPRLRQAAGVTAAITVITVPGAVLFGLVLALAANRRGTGRWLLRLALLLPWATPPGFAGVLFGWFFDTRHGLVNDVLARAGIPPLPFLTHPLTALLAVCVAVIWKTSAFASLVILGGLQTIPGELYEVAAVHDAGRWHTFRRVTLPELRPFLGLALVFRTVGALQTFDIPFAMTHGGPAGATETLAMRVNAAAVEYLNIGYGSALAVLLFVVCLAASLPHLRRINRGAGA